MGTSTGKPTMNPDSPKTNPTEKPNLNSNVKKKHFNCFGPYKLGKTIGQGEFGKVKLGHHLQSGNEVAIKLIKKDSIIQSNRKDKLVREIEILQAVNHRHIVKLWEVIETDNYIGMVLNYAEGGELFDHILARRYLRDTEASQLFAQLILGVSYLHGHGIVHRDLKLENLLLDKNRNLIITDFGFANRFDKEVKGGDLLSTSCGSACYAAPELKYSAEGADIWSCGVILYAMVCGYLPYDDDPSNQQGEDIKKLYKYIMGKKLEFPAQVSVQAQHLILRLLVTDPEKRANINEIQSHRWLSGHKNDFLVQQDGLPRTANLSIGKNKSYLPETRAGKASNNKKASNPLLSSIQEIPETLRSIKTEISDTLAHTISSTTQSACSSTGIVETPLSSNQSASPPPSLQIPEASISSTDPKGIAPSVTEITTPTHASISDTDPKDTAPSVTEIITPTHASISHTDPSVTEIITPTHASISHTDPKDTAPSMTEIEEQRKIGFRKSTDMTPQIRNSISGKGKKVPDELSRAASMDQSRAGIVGITDGLDDEFKKLKAMDGKEIKEKTAIPSKIEKRKQDTKQRHQEKSIFLLKYHSGPIDRRALTTNGPNQILKRLIGKLQEMGFGLFFDPYDPFKIKAVQVKRADGSAVKKSGKKTSAVLGIFERIRYVGQFGLQYNRGYTGTNFPPPPSYQKQRQHLEPIKMYVMVHQIKNLEGLLTVDVKRTRGDIWEFKRVYEELIQKLNLTMA